jgi:Flp pilus assembly protein TadG
MRRARDDRGGVAATAIILPMAFMLLFLVLQVGLWFYGHTLATSAAQHGLDAARVEGGTEADGEEVVQQFLDEMGSTMDVSTLEVDRGALHVTVHVVAEPPSILPGFVPVDIDVLLAAPVERVD